MASFTLTGTSNTPRILSSLEFGFIGVNGALVVNSTDAIIGTGPTTLTVLGTLAQLDFSISSYAYETTGSTYLTVGSTGNITAVWNAVLANSATTIHVLNDGTIAAGQNALRLWTSDGNASISVTNTGHNHGSS